MNAQSGLRYCLGDWTGSDDCDGYIFQTKPDLILKRGKEVLAIIDTKWKRLSIDPIDKKKGCKTTGCLSDDGICPSLSLPSAYVAISHCSWRPCRNSPAIWHRRRKGSIDDWENRSVEQIVHWKEQRDAALCLRAMCGGLPIPFDQQTRKGQQACPAWLLRSIRTRSHGSKDRGMSSTSARTNLSSSSRRCVSVERLNRRSVDTVAFMICSNGMLIES